MVNKQRLICQIDGDGIGKEVVPAAIRVIESVLPELHVQTANAGWETFLNSGDSVPDETLARIKDVKAAIFGAVSSPSKKVPGYQSAILKIRKQLNLNANVRPIDARFGRRADKPFRFVIVRENSEGLYSRVEESDGSRAIAHKIVTQQASYEIGQAAAFIASQYNLDRITIVHKANVLPETDGLFLNTVRRAIEDSATSQFVVNDMLVDTAALKIVEEPEQFGVMVMPNLYGDILSDVAAYWCGGLAMAPSLNLGKQYAVCEPVHGSAPDIAGDGVADPRAAVLSLALLCRLFWKDHVTANTLETKVLDSLSAPLEKTSTNEITELLLSSHTVT